MENSRFMHTTKMGYALWASWTIIIMLFEVLLPCLTRIYMKLIKWANNKFNSVRRIPQTEFGESWKKANSDNTNQWPYLNGAISQYQDPTEADKLLKIGKDLEETKIMLHKTIESVLARGEKLDDLVQRSSDLSSASQFTDVLQADTRNQPVLCTCAL